MSVRLTVIDAIAVLAGAIIGLIVADIVAWAFFNTAFLGMVSSLGRWIIVLITVVLFAVYYRVLPPTGAAIAAFFTGIFLPLVAEKIVLGSSLPFNSLLVVFAVFSLVALFTYRFVHANGVVRDVAGELGRGGNDRF
ncbi:hypothetical protein [Jiella sp. M17.18]|uniref:hypothetical protein n=1 Tax=Jiella sp. M17.18 TaxID=3234247 RepID=UPI0034DDE792